MTWTLFHVWEKWSDRRNYLKLCILFNRSIVGEGGYLNPTIKIKETWIESVILIGNQSSLSYKILDKFDISR